MATDGRIVDSAEYGRHIDLTCRNHPTKKWFTKNISPIGCRTIFVDMYEPECGCPLRDLIPANPDPMQP